MSKLSILLIERFEPKVDLKPYLAEYVVKVSPGGTVLEAISYVRERLDTTLAIRATCRFKNCGLCAVTIDDNPKISCLTRFKSGLKVGPLKKLPVIKDLVVDRRFLIALFRTHQLYVMGNGDIKVTDSDLSEKWRSLIKCRDCLCCLAACPKRQGINSDFIGPYIFLKLALLHFDPRDNQDRKKQAQSLGIENCKDCGQCRCPYGILIFKNAVIPLLS